MGPTSDGEGTSVPSNSHKRESQQGFSIWSKKRIRADNMWRKKKRWDSEGTTVPINAFRKRISAVEKASGISRLKRQNKSRMSKSFLSLPQILLSLTALLLPSQLHQVHAQANWKTIACLATADNCTLTNLQWDFSNSAQTYKQSGPQTDQAVTDTITNFPATNTLATKAMVAFFDGIHRCSSDNGISKS